MPEASKQAPVKLVASPNPATRLWNWLTAPSLALSDPDEKRTARLAASFLLIIALLDLVGGLARIHTRGIASAFSGNLGFSMLTAALSYGLARTKWYRAAIFVFALGFSAFAYLSIAEQGSQADFGALLYIYVPLGLIVASSFLSPWAVWLLTGLNIGALFFVSGFGFAPWPDNFGALSGITTIFGLVLVVLTNFRNQGEQNRLQEVQKINQELEKARLELEQRVLERTAAAEAARLQAESARLEAENARREIEAQMWLTAGAAQLAEKMRGEQEIPDLAKRVITHLCQYLGAQAGALFILESDRLKLVGGYAYQARPGLAEELAPNEGLVGRVAQENKISVIEVPEEALIISSGLIEARPRQVVLAPIRENGCAIGVLELASLATFSPQQLNYLEQIAENVGIAFQTAQAHARVAALLTETQMQAQELQAQEEELRAANEELQAQADNLRLARKSAGKKQEKQ